MARLVTPLGASFCIYRQFIYALGPVYMEGG